MHNVLATSISFFVSLIFNYLASMKFVFKHRPDMARWMEIAIFFVAALIGWFMNEAIVWTSTSWMPHDSMYSMHTKYVLWTDVGKLVATVVVMIWNFVIRKWLLDDTHTNAMNRLRKSENPFESGRARSEVGEQLLASAWPVVARAYAGGLAEVARYALSKLADRVCFPSKMPCIREF